jgi:hypothetical protein
MTNDKPLAIDLYCGLGGWAEGLLSEGWRVVGFDIEAHDYGTGGYPGQLVIQDVTTLHGSQFRAAALIVASPPCQAYSYRAMPWSRAKALPPPDNTLFEACFRIQREASEAAGHHIPLIVENVRGAQKWVGRAKWNFGSYYLWGDVPALMPPITPRKVAGFRFDGVSHGSFQSAAVNGLKVPGNKLCDNGFTIPVARTIDKSLKPDTFALNAEDQRQHLSFSRKAASATIAKIPFPLAQHIAQVFNV